jgi:hypothetical protein
LCQNGGLSVLSSIGETEKGSVGGDRQSCYFWPKILWWKTKCETVHCRDAPASSFVTKVPGEVFAHFQAVAVKVTVVSGNDCLGSKDEFFMNNPLTVKENDDHALYFDLNLSRPFPISVSLNFPYTAHAVFPERSSNHCQSLHRTFPRFVKKLMLFVCRINREIASGQIRDSK